MNIGRATAHLFKKKGHAPKIIIGKDTRISGYMLENALVSGICSMGVNAILVGVIPTPGIAFLTGSMRADAGIVISASHNPFQDNGIKIFGGEGFKLPDETEAAIEEIIFANNLHTLRPSPAELGKAYRMDDARGRYIVFLKHTFPKEHSLEGTRIVLDCSHGATYRVAPDTFFELGAEVDHPLRRTGRQEHQPPLRLPASRSAGRGGAPDQGGRRLRLRRRRRPSDRRGRNGDGPDRGPDPGHLRQRA